jgi:hypothetical protein
VHTFDRRKRSADLTRLSICWGRLERDGHMFFGSYAISVGALTSWFAQGGRRCWASASPVHRKEGSSGAPQARPDTSGWPTLDEAGGSLCASHDYVGQPSSGWPKCAFGLIPEKGVPAPFSK